MNPTLVTIAGLIVGAWSPSAEPASPRPAMLQSEAGAQRVRPIRLRSGDVVPQEGVAPDLVAYARQQQALGNASIHLVAQRADVPDSARWREWQRTGIHSAGYLGEKNWILRVDLGVDAAASLTRVSQAFGATALVTRDDAHKIEPSLARGTYSDWAFDADTGLVKVVVLFFQDAPQRSIDAALRPLHRGLGAHRQIGPSLWALEIHPADLATLALHDAIHFIEEGPLPQLPLMNDLRTNTGAEAVQRINWKKSPPEYKGLTGAGVHLSNGEGLNIDHEDFWNHDECGVRTTPRWVGCPSGNGNHGAMTAGIMLGNGFSSASAGGRALDYRGIAPEAIFDCQSGAHANNHSFVGSYGDYDSPAASLDTTIRNSRRVHVGAVANQGYTPQYGVEAGYYSVYRNAKNEIVVGNITPDSFQWNFSSAGPTWDGRIKPDLSAPGGYNTSWPRELDSIPIEIDYVRILGTNARLWDFDSTGPDWHGGWGEVSWWGRRYVGPIVQDSSHGETVMRVPHLPGPFALVGTITDTNAIDLLDLSGASNDFVQVRYRTDNVPSWSGATANIQWADDYTDYYDYPGKNAGFEIIADGEWHTATVHVGAKSEWTSTEPIHYLGVFCYVQSMLTPDGYAGKDGYRAASGSSAAAPVVTGAVALLLEKTVDEFGVQLSDNVSPSPYWATGGSTGVFLSSTAKAILIQTASDLVSIPNDHDPINPDTGARTFYHRGPDLVTGYGVVDIEEAVRLIDADAEARLSSNTKYIVEDELTSTSTTHVYTIDVPPGQQELKVTLAWDDAPGDPTASQIVPKLVNDLDVVLLSPGAASTHYPWSIDQPYTPSDPHPTTGDYPGVVEPEPIGANDIRPARRDVRNERDNLEQVAVEFPATGQWTVLVLAGGMTLPPQKYSLVLGTPPKPAENLDDGRVVFGSTRASSIPQVFLQDVGSTSAPLEFTDDPEGTFHGVWSPNGEFVATISPGEGNDAHRLRILNTAGVEVANVDAEVLGGSVLSHLDWSSDGKKIAAGVFDSWGSRGVSVVEFASPYVFTTFTAYATIPMGSEPDHLDATDPIFSPDGNFIFFHAPTDTTPNSLFRVLATGGTPLQLYADGEPLRWAAHPSVSPDGRYVIFNSEMWREDPVKYLDDELLRLDLLTGAVTQLTREIGHQYGYYAINGSGEFVLMSSPTAGANYDLFLMENETREPFYIADPGNIYQDLHPSWWKEPKAGRRGNVRIRCFSNHLNPQ